MKNLFLALATTVMATVSVAQSDNSIAIQKGDMSVYSVQPEVANTRVLAAGTRGERTIVTLRFMLGSCVDRLAAVNYSQSVVDGKAILFVQGLAVANEFGMRVRCVAPAIEMKDISIWGAHEKDELLVQAIQTVVVSKVQHPVTCMAFWSGAVYDASTNSCEARGQSGCSNPFEFSTVAECKAAHGLN